MAKFNGFTGAYFTFFDKLKKNNTKQWFEQHRDEYDEYVMHPAREYVIAMGEKLHKIAPEINAIPKINKSLFKINRDVRFSKDKSPYKTYMGIWLWEGTGKRMESSGFYLHVEDKKMLIGVGIKLFPKPLLDRFRNAVVDKKQGAAFKSTIKKVIAKGYLISGKHYKKVPRGFDADHPNAEYLLYNGLTARIEEKVPAEFFSSDLAEYAYTHYKNMLHLHRWLKNMMN